MNNQNNVSLAIGQNISLVYADKPRVGTVELVAPTYIKVKLAENEYRTFTLAKIEKLTIL